MERAEEWRWPSAGVRLNGAASEVPLELNEWSERFDSEQWRELLAHVELSTDDEQLRVSTYTGRPLGEEGFMKSAETTLRRKLIAGKGGRPRRTIEEPGQGELFASSSG